MCTHMQVSDTNGKFRKGMTMTIMYAHVGMYVSNSSDTKSKGWYVHTSDVNGKGLVCTHMQVSEYSDTNGKY